MSLKKQSPVASVPFIVCPKAIGEAGSVQFGIDAASNAPISVPSPPAALATVVSTVRANPVPRWSVITPDPVLLPLSSAGLPPSRAWVGVVPPLFANKPSCGLRGAAPVPNWSPMPLKVTLPGLPMRLKPFDTKLPPLLTTTSDTLELLTFAATMLLRRVTVVEPAALTPPALNDPVEVLFVTVLFVIVAAPALPSVMPPAVLDAFAIFPLTVELRTVSMVLLKIPPPPLAVLFEIVLPSTESEVAVASAIIPPPKVLAVLPVTMQFESVTCPPVIRSPPPNPLNSAPTPFPPVMVIPLKLIMPELM